MKYKDWMKQLWEWRVDDSSQMSWPDKSEWSELN